MVDYGWDGRKYTHMKTTLEIDEGKLEKIMRLMSFKTRKDAVDWALTEAERLAVMENIKANPWSADVLREGYDDDYAEMMLRRRDIRSGNAE